MSEVRSFQGGRLRMSDNFGRQLLPLTSDKKTCVKLDTQKGPCFFAGKITHLENRITILKSYNLLSLSLSPSLSRSDSFTFAVCSVIFPFVSHRHYIDIVNAGDGRIEQIISLTAFHILFAREHNRIADVLSDLNPRWSDEVLFLEARRVVQAELQHITYNEWLPVVIGGETIQRFSLGIRENGYSDDYNPDVNPSITSEFSTAAQRFGHSTVDGKFL